VKQALADPKSNPSPSSSKALISTARKMWPKSHSKEKQFNAEKEHSRRQLNVIGMALYFRGFNSFVCLLISQNWE